MLASTRAGVWKALEIGGEIVTVSDFEAIMDDLNISGRMENIGKRLAISENASGVLRSPAFGFSEDRLRIRLVKISLRQLGFKRKATRGEIYNSAYKLGLLQCPIYVGPLLRLCHLHQAEGERLIVASEPIRGGTYDDNGKPQFNAYSDLFLVNADAQTLWLRAVAAGAMGRWDNEFQWVFADMS